MLKKILLGTLLVSSSLCLAMDPILPESFPHALLHHEAYMGNLNGVHYLVNQRANVNYPNCYGLTPLMQAAQMARDIFSPISYLDIVQILLAAGADPRATTKEGKTALDFCEQNTGGPAAKQAIRAEIEKTIMLYMQRTPWINNN